MNLFNSKSGLAWRDYLRIFKRSKWYFIIPFFLVIPLGIYKILTSVPVYESYSVVQIEPSRLLSSNLRRVVPGVIGQDNASALKKRILSAEYLTELIYRLNLHIDENVQEIAELRQQEFPHKSREEILEYFLIKRLKEVVKVRSYGSDIIEIKTTAKTPELAYRIIKTLTDIFIDESLRGELSSVQSVLRFNDEQLAIFKEKLEKAELKLQQYKKGLISSKVETRPLSEEALKNIREAILSIDVTIKEKKDYLSYLESHLQGNGIFKSYPKTPFIQKSEDDIHKRIQQMATLMESYTWNSPQVIKVNQSINNFRENVQREFERIVKAGNREIDAQQQDLLVKKTLTLYDLNILNQKRNALNKSLDTFKIRVSQNPSKESILSKLQEEVNINREIYTMFLEQNQGAQIEESMQRADASSRFKIIEHPIKPLEPINAGYRMILFMTFVFATGLGAGSIYLRETLDKSIRSVQEAEEYLRVPVVGVIPYVGGSPTINYKKRIIALITLGFTIIFTILLFLYFQQST